MSEITRINRAARWLMELASELESIYNSSVGEKYKIMLLMTYIDILSKIWHFHNNNISKKQGEYFKVWMNEFMFSNLNKSYNKKEIGNIDSNVFYQVRNSLIHFSSIPNISNVGIFISSDSKSEFCNRYPNETAGREIIVLSSKILLPIFLKASISTIEKMAEQDDKYKNTMLWIAGRLEKESGFIINPDFRDDILNFTNKHSNKTVEEK